MSDTETADTADATVTDDERQALIDVVQGDLGDGFVDAHLVPGVDLWIRVTAEAWPRALAVLKERGFDFFDFLSVIDWLPSPWGNSESDPLVAAAPVETEMLHGYTGGDTRFQVFARLSRLAPYAGVTIKADIPESLEVGSVVTTFAGANWHEREAHEMFGITFNGHPDLRNLYLPTEFEGYPLRKDFPLLARHIKPWPGIVDVEPMPAGEGDDESADAAGDES